jgi:WD40-like Beta Propeller Repeat
MSIRKRALVLALVIGVVLTAAFAASAGPFFSAWSTAQKIDDIAGNHLDVNTPSLDGCPIESPDGLSLYMASNRPGGKGGLDIWVATRASRGDPWGAPVNLPEPINSATDDFCPTPIHADGLLFVSRRVITGVTCGLGDIYVIRRNPAHGWSEPQHLGCDPAGPNSALDEQGPSYVQGRLYFSRSTLPPGNSGELYVSEKQGDMRFRAASPIAELNDPGANDIQPNVRKDGREIVFSSNRAGGLGGPDIWSATRASVNDPWSVPVNLGSNVNTGLGESRPSLSWDAQQLLFGRAGPVGTGEGGTGMSDIYVTTREKSND